MNKQTAEKDAPARRSMARLTPASAQRLRLAFAGTPDGFRISSADRLRVNQAAGGDRAATYGELAPTGVASLAHALKLGEHSLFYDLGSGRGSVVLHVALGLDPPVRRAVGIELSRERHEIAQRAKLRLGAAAHRARFSCDDLQTACFADATEVYVANLVFPPSLDAVLSARLAQCDGLRRVATLKPLEAVPPRMTLACRLRMPFTWAERCGVWVYERKRVWR
eukprot:6344700-Prymnesium_polylepis.1